MAVTRNADGDWVPAIPLPFRALRKWCGCGRWFWTTPCYRGHYALVHILRLEDT